MALYNHPSRFTRSVHADSRRIDVTDGESVENADRLPAPMTLRTSCTDLEEGVTLAMHGWDNDDDPPGDEFANDFDIDDEVLLGFQQRIGPAVPSGPQVGRSADLVVSYHFVVTGEPCEPVEEDLRTVPHVLFSPGRVAAQDVRAAGLEPRFSNPGVGLEGTFVEDQQPVSGRRVLPGSIVTMKLRKGPIP
jgi:hypothetical protein